MKKLITSLSLFFLSILTGYATQVPDKNNLLFLDNFAFGLYTNAIGNKLPKNAAKVLRNFLIDEKNGSLVRNNGFTVLGSTTGVSKINFILPFIKSDNTVEFLVTDNSSLLSTVDFVIYKPVFLGLSGTNDLVGIQTKTKTWWTNGINSVFTYDGSTVTVMDGNTYGTLQTPNIPKGRCIEYDLKSIWVGNIPTDNSLIAWSAIFSTAGDRIDPDNYLAWPTANQASVGLGDGQQLTFLKTFGGTLVAGKERSIYSRYGDSDTNFIFIKTKSKIGFLSQLSVIEHENLLFGQAYDGFYAFDGQNVESISDYIKPDFDSIRADTTKNVTNVWDTQADFNRGYFSNTQVSADGFVTLSTANFSNVISSMINNVNNIPPQSSPPLLYVVPSFDYLVFAPTVTLVNNNNFLLRISSIGIYLLADGVGNTVKVNVKNSRTGQIKKFIFTNTNNNTVEYHLSSTYEGDDPFFTKADISGGKLMIGYETPGITSYYVYQATGIGNADIYIQISTDLTGAGQYISDITTTTNNSAWGNFDSTYQSNTGAASFFFRASTGLVNISTYPWIPISPGSVINSTPSNSFIQWAATITNEASIDNVTIGHNEGNSSITRSFGIDYLGRLWIGVSTESTGNFPLIYVKCRKTNTQNPIAWSQFEGIPIRYIVKYQNYLYAGHASTGSVLRLDYGTNYGGQPITSVYESPDLALENSYNQLGVSYKDIYGFTYKDVWEYMIDANSSNSANLRIGTSLDGRDYNYNTVALTNANNTITSVRNPNGGQGTFGRLVRIRFDNSEIDKDLIVNNFGVIYIPTKIR